MIDKICKIFQPTLPVRGATALNLAQSQANQFQPTLPVRGATVQSSIRDVIDSQFQPTLPVRGATVRRARQHRQHREISTHAPRAGSDLAAMLGGCRAQFQPTLPVRGATAIYCVDRVLLSICRPKKSDWPRKTSCKDLKEAECGANLPRDAWEPHVRTADYSAKNPSASYVGFAPTCSIFV